MGEDGLFGGLISAGASLLGGMFNRAEQQKVNQSILSSNAAANAQNWANALWMDTHHIQNIANDARRAGISPLAALGVNTPSVPTAVGATPQASGSFGKGVQQAGQDISEAVTRYMNDNSRKAVLEEELLKAQIARENADTAGQMLSNSRAARVAGPGARAAAAPAFAKFDSGAGFEFTGPSKELSQAVMNAASWPLVLPLGAGLIGHNLVSAARGLDRWSGGWTSNPGYKVRQWLRDRKGTTYQLPGSPDTTF